MSVSQYENAETFAAIVEPLIATDRGRSTIAATVLHGLIASPEPERLPVMVVVRSGETPVGLALAGASSAASALITQLISEDLPTGERDEVGRLLASAFLGLDPAPAIVTGPADGSKAFATGYCAATRGEPHSYLRMLLYRLDRLIEPEGVTGSPRIADVDDAVDLELLGRWRMEFAQATGTFPPANAPDPDAARKAAERGVTSVLWTVDAEAVCWAAHSAVVGGMVRVGPVYTPEPLRGNGYAAAATAAAVRSAQAAGATEVVLFTDATNPTSNGIYLRIGFVPRGCFAEVALRADPIGSTAI